MHKIVEDHGGHDRVPAGAEGRDDVHRAPAHRAGRGVERPADPAPDLRPSGALLVIQDTLAGARARVAARSRATPIRVLVVSGQPAEMERVRQALSPAFVVESCASGGECVARLARDPVDVLLLGRDPGDTGGVELLHALRARSIEVPAVLVVEAAGAAMVAEARAFGASECLVDRPADLARLPRVLEHAAAQGRAASTRAGFAIVTRLLADVAAGLEPGQALRRIVEATAALLGDRAGGCCSSWSGARPWCRGPGAGSGRAGSPKRASRRRPGCGPGSSPPAGVTRLDPMVLAEPWSAVPVLAELSTDRPSGAGPLAVPIATQGRPLGIVLAAAPARGLGKTDEAALRALADVAALVVEQLRVTEELLHAERLSTVGRMVASVAHELNNPLAVIVGTVDMLRHEAIPERTAERLGRVLAQAQRAIKIVRTLLALARKRPPEPAPVDVNGLLADTLELAAYDLKRAEVRLAAAVPGRPAGRHRRPRPAPAGLHQPGAQCLPGDPRPGPRRAAQDHDGRGAGDRVDRRPARRRRSRDPTRAPPPNLRAVLHHQGGRPGNRARSGDLAPDRGEPRGADHGDERAGRWRRVPDRAPAGHRGGGPGEVAPRPEAGPVPAARVLLVEDEALVGDMLEDLLALDGHQVDRATNGREALERMRSRSYALIVSDVRMPDLSGPALYRELLRVHPALARRVVFVTGDIVSPETRRFLDETGLGYLAKPFAVSEFQSAIRRVLASRSRGSRSPLSALGARASPRSKREDKPAAIPSIVGASDTRQLVRSGSGGPSDAPSERATLWRCRG